MLPQKHFIQRNIFHVTIGDKRRFHGLADRISICFRQDLRRAMEQIFDAHVPPEQTIQLRRMEIDLGFIPESQLEAVLTEKFPRILEEQLLEILSTIQPSARIPVSAAQALAPRAPLDQAAVLRSVDKRIAGSAALIMYLNYGHFPVGFYLAEDESLDTLVHSVIDTAGEAFKEALLRVEKKTYVARRIGRQLGEETYWKVVGLFLPRAIQALQSLIAELSGALGQLRARISLPTDTARSHLQELLISYLLAESPLTYQREIILRYLLTPYSMPGQQTVLRPVIDDLAETAGGLKRELLSYWAQHIDELVKSSSEALPETPKHRERGKEHAPLETTLDADVAPETVPEERPEAETVDHPAEDEEDHLLAQEQEQREEDLVQELDRDSDAQDTTIQPPTERAEDEVPAGVDEDVLAGIRAEQQHEALLQVTQPYDFLRDASFTTLLGESMVPWWAAEQVDAVVPVTLPLLIERYRDRFVRDMRLFISTLGEDTKQRAFDILVSEAHEPLLMQLAAALQPELPGYYRLLADFLQHLDQESMEIKILPPDRPYTLFLRPMVYHAELATSTQHATWQAIVAMARISDLRPVALLTALQQQADALIRAGERRFSPVKHTLQALIQSQGLARLQTPDARDESEERPVPDEVQEVPVYTAEQALIEFAKGLYGERETARLEESEVLWHHFVRHGSLPLGSTAVSARAFSQRISELLDRQPQMIVSTLHQHRSSLIRHPSMELLESDLIWKIAEQATPDTPSFTRLKEWAGLLETIRPKTDGIPEALVTQYILLSALRTPPPPDLVTFIQELITFLSKIQGRAAIEIASQLLKRTEKIATTQADKLTPLQRTLAAQVQILTKTKRQAAPEADILRIPWRTEEVEELYVHNAGIVLLWPFLGHYFKQLDMLSEENTFHDEATALRAVHLLEYLATRRVATPEYALTLNKLLCGVELDVPTDKGIEMTERETQISESMLGAVIKQWQALKSTSPDGLRGGFLLREGVLTKRVDEDWKLRVEQKPYDILLDKLPWGINLIKLKWCPYLVHVEWR